MSDSWQGIRVTAGLVPAALLLSLFNPLRSSIFNCLEEIMLMGHNHTDATFPACLTGVETALREASVELDAADRQCFCDFIKTVTAACYVYRVDVC